MTHFWINTSKAMDILVETGGFKDREEYLNLIGYSQIFGHPTGKNV